MILPENFSRSRFKAELVGSLSKRTPGYPTERHPLRRLGLIDECGSPTEAGRILAVEILASDRLRARLRESVAREMLLLAHSHIVGACALYDAGANAKTHKRLGHSLQHYAALIREHREPEWVTRAMFGASD